MSDSDKKLLESSLLKKLNDDGSIGNSREFVDQLGKSSLTHELFDGVLRSLTALEIVATKAITTEGYQLTEEGKNYLEKGTPEVQLFHLVRHGSSASSSAAAVSASGVSAAELESKLGGQFAIARNQSMKKKWLKYDKASNTFALNVDTITDEINPLLKKVAAGEKMDEKLLKELKDRKMIAKYSITSYSITKGPKFTLERKKVATDLTTELIKSGDWEKSEFKEYNVAPGELNEVGCLHPLLKVREEFRIILLEMGFSEMPTARFVESSFWNFDALFQPQQHPARDSHDTFFLKNPAKTVRIDQEYLKKVKDMHEKGDNISLGYRYDWKLEEAEKNILRTHTTAISTRMLYQLAKKKPFQPTKMFSIDRVFRNETLDATHLAEFHQVEGLIADRNLTLGDLMGVIHTFFTKIGMTELRFKPAYNPYTEPSMEIFAKSPELGRWIEIGNSGIFRPEMLRPMGLPEDVTVIAWGLSLERPTMIKYGLGNIRKLFGPGVSLKVIKDNGIARFDNPNALVDQVGQE